MGNEVRIGICQLAVVDEKTGECGKSVVDD